MRADFKVWVKKASTVVVNFFSYSSRVSTWALLVHTLRGGQLVDYDLNYLGCTSRAQWWSSWKYKLPLDDYKFSFKVEKKFVKGVASKIKVVKKTFS